MKIRIIWIVFFVLSACSNIATETDKADENEKITFESQFAEIKKLNSPSKSSLRGISVVNDSVAWFSGANGTILRTIDGGKTIQKINPPPIDTLDHRDVFAFSRDTVVLINSGFPPKVYRTSNAGKKWNLAFNFPAKELFYNAVEFVNKDFGLIYGDPVNGKHFILVSGNEGKNWISPPVENLIEAVEPESGFAASGSSIAFSPNRRAFIGLGGEKGRVLTSMLPYKEWVAIETPIYKGKATRGIYSITFKDNNIGVAVGGDYTEEDLISVETSIYTTDGGKTWKNPESALSGYRSCVAYCDEADVFIAVGPNGIDRSIDNGNNWSKISDISANSIQFIKGSNKGYLIDGKGNVYSIEIK